MELYNNSLQNEMHSFMNVILFFRNYFALPPQDGSKIASLHTDNQQTSFQQRGWRTVLN